MKLLHCLSLEIELSAYAHFNVDLANVAEQTVLESCFEIRVKKYWANSFIYLIIDMYINEDLM